MAQIKLKDSQIIHTHDVIRVFMGIGHGMHDSYFFSQELRPHIGGSIDEEISLWQPKNDRTASPLISRMITAADITAASQCWHSYAGTGSQNDKLARNIRCKWFFFQDRGTLKQKDRS